MSATEIYREVELVVEYDYQPEEKMVRYYADGSGYPGCAEDASIYSIKLGKTELIQEFTSDEISKMEDEIIENMHSY